jgi:hypothetical protein
LLVEKYPGHHCCLPSLIGSGGEHERQATDLSLIWRTGLRKTSCSAEKLAIFVAPNRADFVNVPVTLVPSGPTLHRAIDRKSWNRIETMPSLLTVFSSEVESGSHEENASNQENEVLHRFCETVRGSGCVEFGR